MAKSFFEEVTGYRVKVERDGKEIVNVPGIFALPGLLAAPRLSLLGMVAAPLLGCSVHLENDAGKEVDVGKAVKDAANTVAETADTMVRTVREEMKKAWDAMIADDPEGCPIGKENEEETEEETEEENEEETDGQKDAEGEAVPEEETDGQKDTEGDAETPTIHVMPEDPEKK